MARSVIEAAFISAEKVQFDDVKLLKLFVGDEPDGVRDLGVSLLSMNVSPDSLDEVWAACQGLDVLEPIRITAEIDRGSKNAGKFIVLQLEPVKAKAADSRSVSPATPATPAAKSEPAKG